MKKIFFFSTADMPAPLVRGRTVTKRRLFSKSILKEKMN